MSFLTPTSVAVIGASADEGSVGHEILKNLLNQGFIGHVYPINPKHEEILNTKTYKSVKDIPESVDLAVIVVPAKITPVVLKECIEKEIPSVAVISAGFAEVHTEEGKKLEEELKSLAEDAGIHLIGPNCLGVLRPHLKLNASFAKDMPPMGNVAFVSQSGATAVALMDSAAANGIGYSSVLSIGNKACMDECDFLEILLNDKETKVIGMYLESIKDGRRFLEVAKKVSAQKPIVLLKAGTSEHGKKAASSHTGALAGSDTAIDAACIETGIYRAKTLEEFNDLLAVLSTQPTLLSSNIAVVTNAGGPGILATDAAEKEELQLVHFETKTVEILQKNLPAAAAIGNPVDVIGDADAERYRIALDAIAADKNVDGVCVLLTPQVMTPCAKVAESITQIAAKNPLMPFVCGFLGDTSLHDAKHVLQDHNIPNFSAPERAIAALGALRKKEGKQTQPEQSEMRKTRAEEILEGTSGLLSEEQVQKLFELYALSMPKAKLAKTKEEAVEIAEDIGYPVIAKIASPQILHKTDIGGVKANLRTEEELKDAYEEMLKNTSKEAKGADIQGVLIQQFLPVGSEFIVGALRDASFGPMVMVGLGGIYTELFADTSFRMAPVSPEHAYEMLHELKAWKLLQGMRGKEQLNRDALAETIVKISELMNECESIVEIDLNPVLVGEKDIVIADVKIVIS